MEAGTRVWHRDKQGDEAWILALVVKRTDDELCVQHVNQPDVAFSCPAVKSSSSGTVEVLYEGVERANEEIGGEDQNEGFNDNLTLLPHLNEPAMLHSISQRFFRDHIYTWTGTVLIAVNPFKRLPLYTNETLEKYRGEGLLRSQKKDQSNTNTLSPHVFAVADRSFRQMMRKERRSQSILISGESGAGKTESTKFVVQYLTALGSATSCKNEPFGEQTIMDRVMQSNPILEAFGNACTLRNDNSSRFGKFIDLGFDAGGNLLGAKVQTYLLERVRLVSHAPKERSYHIFYQLLQGSTDEQKQRYIFPQDQTPDVKLPSFFHYTRQGGAPKLRELSDEEGFQRTVTAMKSLGWSDDKVDSVFALVAGLLHIGQIEFESEENENGISTARIVSESSLDNAARLLSVDVGKLRTALTERVLVARGQDITTPLSIDKAVGARDALAKTVYVALFLWLVNQVNESICWESEEEVRSCCSVLDIFGFECFTVNSFEQLCINFANEALQQQFNNYMFKIEETLCEKEGIKFCLDSFPDNQDCLDIIQHPRTGIFALLDDELRLPGGNGRNWATRMYRHFLQDSDKVQPEKRRFRATPFEQSKSIFCVNHFAGPVNYSAQTGFVEKNKDEIPWTTQNLFRTASGQLMRDIGAAQQQADEGRASAEPQRRNLPKKKTEKTVGGQFKHQLSKLIKNIDRSDPHYIRCLKPNDDAKPGVLERKRLTDQLRNGGVLEAVRVARISYPVRLDHATFVQRYRMLLPSKPIQKLPWQVETENLKESCIQLMEHLLQSTARNEFTPCHMLRRHPEEACQIQVEPTEMTFKQSDIQVGLSKVFMRKPSHDALETRRSFYQYFFATLIQKTARGQLERKAFTTMKSAALCIQKLRRGFSERKRYQALRRSRAGQTLNNDFRMLLALRRYHRMKRGFVRLQSLCRSHIERMKWASIKIQTRVRTRKLQREHRHLKSAALAIQRAVRRHIDRKKFEDLRPESNDNPRTLAVDCLVEIQTARPLTQQVTGVSTEGTRQSKSAARTAEERETEKTKWNETVAASTLEKEAPAVTETELFEQSDSTQIPERETDCFLPSHCQAVSQPDHHNSRSPTSDLLWNTSEEMLAEREEQIARCEAELITVMEHLQAAREESRRLQTFLDETGSGEGAIEVFVVTSDNEGDKEALTAVRARYFMLLTVVITVVLYSIMFLQRRRYVARVVLTILSEFQAFEDEHWQVVDEALDISFEAKGWFS